MVTLGRPAPLHDLLARCAGAAGVVASCASLALLVVVRINKRVVAPTVHLDDVKELSILCAGCGRKLILPVGRSACTMCRMEYEIRVQEPQCVQCGYSLYNLTSDRCPECGLVIHRGEALNPA